MKYFVSQNLPSQYSSAQECICNSFYVDGGLDSKQTVDEAVEVLSNARSILSTYNVRLHKIVSNSSELLKHFSDSEVACAPHQIHSSATPYQQALGVTWDPTSDNFVVSVNIPSKPFTRRGIVSKIGTLYEPLGLFSPVILGGRLFQTQVLSIKQNKEDKNPIDFDSKLPETLVQPWLKWVKSLPELKKIQVPQCFCPQFIHVPSSFFCDASDNAIGCVSYIRCVNESNVYVSFVSSASKVVPRAAVSIPRLELCAALEAAKHAFILLSDLNHKPSHTFMYSDSNLVLGYIINTQKRFSKYVERRVNMILQLTLASMWYYIPTHDNPGD